MVLCLNVAQCTFAQVTQYSLFAKYTISDFAHFLVYFYFYFYCTKIDKYEACLCINIAQCTFAQFTQKEQDQMHVRTILRQKELHGSVTFDWWLRWEKSLTSMCFWFCTSTLKNAHLHIWTTLSACKRHKIPPNQMHARTIRRQKELDEVLQLSGSWGEANYRKEPG